jgi:hypothetical protein
MYSFQTCSMKTHVTNHCLSAHQLPSYLRQNCESSFLQWTANLTCKDRGKAYHFVNNWIHNNANSASAYKATKRFI